MKKTSIVQNSKVIKRNNLEIVPDAIEPQLTSKTEMAIYTFTEKFKLWIAPWTFHFLSRLDSLGFLNVRSQQELHQPIKKYAVVHDLPAHLFAEATVGVQHRLSNIQLPCQDAVKISNKPRPILIVSDGAGSAAVSDLGSQALVRQLTRLCQSLEPMIAPLLDTLATQDFSALVRVIIRHAIGTLNDCADIHRRPIRDFRSTLNFAIVGIYHTLWIRVGDGEIIQEQIFVTEPNHLQAEYHFCGTLSKGEFANQTQFIDDQLQLNDVQWGILDTTRTTGLVLMSDGATEKLVNNQRNQVAGQITQWLQQLRGDQLKVAEIFKRFYSEDFLNRSSGDDRSIALYSRQYELKSENVCKKATK